LNLRPPGYEPPRLCTRVPPCSVELQTPSRFSGRCGAFRRNTVTSLRKPGACRTLAAWRLCSARFNPGPRHHRPFVARRSRLARTGPSSPWARRPSNKGSPGHITRHSPFHPPISGCHAGGRGFESPRSAELSKVRRGKGSVLGSRDSGTSHPSGEVHVMAIMAAAGQSTPDNASETMPSQGVERPSSKHAAKQAGSRRDSSSRWLHLRTVLAYWGGSA
jgi:hypothetical protein